MIQRWLSVDGDDTLGAVQGFLRGLLESGTVEALLAPCRTTPGEMIMPALIRDPSEAVRFDPLAPVMPVNAARLLSQLTAVDTGRRLGVVLRPCEWRAVVELTKLRQINLEHVLTIGVDCLGTYEPLDYMALVRAGERPEVIWEGAPRGQPRAIDGYAMRPACQVCVAPIPEGVDIRIGLIGLTDSSSLLIESHEELLLPVRMGNGQAGRRDAVVSRLVEQRRAARAESFGQWRAQVRDITSLLTQFSSCIRCHNCMVVCPICYCRECVFRTATFEHESEQYFRWAERKGALRMPSDTLLFHLTRLNHMVTSCIGCGMCDSACPSRLPVSTLFQATAERTQALFDYVAGRSLEEELPLATFREDELSDVGM